MNACPYTADKIIAAMLRKRHVVFQKEYDLNIVGVRSVDTQSNQFNDWLCVFHLRANGTWAFYALQATTDPGMHWRLNPEAAKGVAIVMPGQYRGLWKLGLHQGKYPALVQVAPIKVYRDADRDGLLEPDAAKVETGIFGINLHRARAEAGASTNVDKWSAGCQVVAADEDLDMILELVQLQKQVHGYDTVSYALLNAGDVQV